jgi:hypothetical protein
MWDGKCLEWKRDYNTRIICRISFASGHFSFLYFVLGALGLVCFPSLSGEAFRAVGSEAKYQVQSTKIHKNEK